MYNTIDESLYPVANLLVRHYSRDLGLKVKIEAEISRDLSYIPTIFAQSNSHYMICADVDESNVFNHARRYFISECEKRSLPVKFSIIVPKENVTASTLREISEAKRYGIGVFLADLETGSVELINQALSLSLTGLRMFDKSTFPRKYRENIKISEEVYRTDPNKACSLIYDEIEALTRKIAVKTHQLNLWRTPLADINRLYKMPWSSVIDEFQKNVDRQGGTLCAPFTNTLLAKVLGVTTYRNESGHRPASKSALITRDTQLRTRMESAVDLLLELVNAAKVLRI